MNRLRNGYSKENSLAGEMCEEIRQIIVIARSRALLFPLKYVKELHCWVGCGVHVAALPPPACHVLNKHVSFNPGGGVLAQLASPQGSKYSWLFFFYLIQLN